MGWRELRAWMVVLNKQRAAEAGRDRTDPDSWDGYENDPWWAEQRHKRDEIRGVR